MWRIVIGVLLLAVVAGPALAQRKGEPRQPTPEEIEKKQRQQEIDKQYQNALRNTSTDAAPVKVDPWANMRGDNNNKR